MTTPMPLVSVVLPAFNEASILRDHLLILVDYLDSQRDRYRWEIVIVNDGSSDDTGRIAEDFASDRDNVNVLHHKINYGLGQALKFGMSQTRGDYIVTMDIDLSYSPDHITRLVEALQTSKAKLVLASPYMKGGQISNVPWLRKFLSIGANWFLSMVAHGRLSTLTCMVRGYDGEYGRNLILRATGMEIMPETVYKSMILRAGIHQIPGPPRLGPAGQTAGATIQHADHSAHDVDGAVRFRVSAVHVFYPARPAAVRFLSVGQHLDVGALFRGS